jgi:hypothetical protein
VRRETAPRLPTAAVGLVAEDHLGTHEAGQVPRVPRRGGRERVRRCGVRRGRVPDVPGPGVHEWSACLVREDPAAVPLHHLGSRSSRPAKNTRPAGCPAAEDEQVPAGRNAALISSRSRVTNPSSPCIWTSMISRPTRPGTIRNGMQAGVGTLTGEPGRDKCVIAISSALITSGTGWTDPGSTCHPYRRRSKSAHAAPGRRRAAAAGTRRQRRRSAWSQRRRSAARRRSPFPRLPRSAGSGNGRGSAAVAGDGQARAGQGWLITRMPRAGAPIA